MRKKTAVQLHVCAQVALILGSSSNIYSGAFLVAQNNTKQNRTKKTCLPMKET